MLKELIDELGESFRGLWTSTLYFDSHNGVHKKKEWSVTYTHDNEFLETVGCETPEKAVQFAIKMKTKHLVQNGKQE
jgi:hypothetical protein